MPTCSAAELGTGIHIHGKIKLGFLHRVCDKYLVICRIRWLGAIFCNKIFKDLIFENNSTNHPCRDLKSKVEYFFSVSSPNSPNCPKFIYFTVNSRSITLSFSGYAPSPWAYLNNSPCFSPTWGIICFQVISLIYCYKPHGVCSNKKIFIGIYPLGHCTRVYGNYFVNISRSSVAKLPGFREF